MEFFLVQSLNGISYGLLLFMLSSGLTLVFSLMGVLNFAHASFYMLGAYLAFQVSTKIGFWPALVIAPILVGEAEGEEKLRDVAVPVHLAQAEALHQHAEGADQQRRDDQRRPEADLAAHLECQVGAQHVEAGVREIEHAHQGEDERQARGQHEQQQPVADAVQALDEEELHGRNKNGEL